MKIPGKHRGTRHAAKVGYRTLIETKSALDAVEQAVRSMELNDDFNAGYGSVLTRFFLSSCSKKTMTLNIWFTEMVKFKWTHALWMETQ